MPIVKIRSCIPREALSYNDAWRISNELRWSFYLAHYLICRGREFGSLIFNPQLCFNSTLHDASLLMHPKPCQASKFPVTLVWCLSLRDPNLLRAIHGMNNILGHPNRPVPSICSPPHDMSYHLAIFLLFKYVVVALLLVLVGGLGVYAAPPQPPSANRVAEPP